MNLFTVVRFHNNPCTGSDASSSNGTCYSSEECSIRGGSSVGSCAGGYGVCCTCKYTIYIISCMYSFIFIFSVEYGCGRSTNENCSYFVSASTVDAGECRLKVCPCSEHICQIRLDFDTFVVNQPSGACKFLLTIL